MVIKAIFDAQNWAAVPFHFWSLVFFVLGCMCGSFLNVCIYRLPREMSIITPRSHCPHCQYAIPWYLNIPLVTWLMLRGRCKNCSAPIAPRYFVVELLTGVAFLGCWLAFGDPNHPFSTMLLALVYAIFVAALIAATFIDVEHLIIPDEITLGGAVAGIVVSLLLPALQGAPSHGVGVLRGAIGAVVGAGVIYAILQMGKWLFGRHRPKLPEGAKIIFTETALHFAGNEIPYEELFNRKSDAIVARAKTVEMIDRSYFNAVVSVSQSVLRIKQDGFPDEEFDPETIRHMEIVSSDIILPREAMGFGDVKFMGMIGAFLGWQGVVFSLMVSSFIGAAVGVTLIAMRRREWSSRMPYGPYIALAAAIWIFGGKGLFHAFFPFF